MAEKTIVLAGNPNVGKSTVFNALTGLRQHTGNWPGKTVAAAEGRFWEKGTAYRLIDTPGAYSLLPRSAEEEAARDGVCFSGADLAAVVCDATCLERNLNLVLQVLEARGGGLVVVNLIDEARKKGMAPDLAVLSRRLGVPVLAAAARSGEGLPQLREAFAGDGGVFQPTVYPSEVAAAVDRVAEALAEAARGSVETPTLTASSTSSAVPSFQGLPLRWLALQLLQKDEGLAAPLQEYLGFFPAELPEVSEALEAAWTNTPVEKLRDLTVETLQERAADLAREAAAAGVLRRAPADVRLDRLFTGRLTGVPIMLLLLALLFWLTITGANLPSAALSDGFARLEVPLRAALSAAPAWLQGILLDGVWRVTTWVIAVMLPPMAIFFPLFTLLEDLGYLPRVAFNLDRGFAACHACGKQSLTMCMGFGCNAAGVAGCRIIDSPRERLIAVLTNVFVPCNGRLPALIALLGLLGGGSAGAALGLTGVVVLGVGVTLLCSRLLSATLLRGEPSAFTLELPPYRRPQVGRVLVRSALDRTALVLGRAVAVAAPAGAVIWLFGNVQVGGQSLLMLGAAALDGPGRLMGLDGCILMAFLLAFPANELVLPILLMAYLSAGAPVPVDGLSLGPFLLQNNWSTATVISMALFTLMHWPCSTTLLTIRKETNSWKWTAVAALLPTLWGVGACVLFTVVARLLT